MHVSLLSTMVNDSLAIFGSPLTPLFLRGGFVLGFCLFFALNIGKNNPNKKRGLRKRGFADSRKILIQKTFRYLWRFYSLLFRGFFVVFSWLFRGPLLSRKTVFGPYNSPAQAPKAPLKEQQEQTGAQDKSNQEQQEDRNNKKQLKGKNRRTRRRQQEERPPKTKKNNQQERPKTIAQHKPPKSPPPPQGLVTWAFFCLMTSKFTTPEFLYVHVYGRPSWF